MTLTASWLVAIALFVITVAAIISYEFEGRWPERLAALVGIVGVSYLMRIVGQLDDERHFWAKCFANTVIKDGVRRCVVKG